MTTALRNLTILRKIAAVFAVVVGLVALSGVLSFNLSGELQAAADRQTEAGRLVIAAKDALASAVDLSSHLRGLVMTRIPGNAADIAKDQERFDARIADARRATALSADLAGQIDALQAAETGWRRQLVDVVMPLTASVDTMDQASAMMTTEANRRMVGDIRTAAAQVQATAKALADAAAARHADALALMRGSSLATTLVVALAAAGLSWLLSRLIGTPVVALTASMRRLAGGDVGASVPGAGRRDEIGAMAASLAVFKAAAVEKLRLEADAAAAGRLTEAERARTAAVLAEAAAPADPCGRGGGGRPVAPLRRRPRAAHRSALPGRLRAAPGGLQRRHGAPAGHDAHRGGQRRRDPLGDGRGSRPRPTTCRAAPSSRRPRSRRPRRRSTRSPPRSARPPRDRNMPAASWGRRAPMPSDPARWCARPSRP